MGDNMPTGLPDWSISTKTDIVQQTLAELATGIRTFQAETVEWIIADQSDTVPSGDGESVIIRAPAGYIYEVKLIYLAVPSPSGAGSGFHRFSVMSETADLYVLFGESDYATSLLYNYGYWIQANREQQPSDSVSQLLVIRDLRIDESNGLEIAYFNGTDVDQTYQRVVRLWCRKIKVS